MKKILSKSETMREGGGEGRKFDENPYEECKQNSNSMHERIMNGGQK